MEPGSSPADGLCSHHGGAKLQQVQYAAGHADPRTTERYQKRKINLDNNAVDYLHF